MNSSATRREVLTVASQSALAATVFAGLSNRTIPSLGTNEPIGNGELWLGYPRQDQTLVAELVGVSHFNQSRVKELVQAYPELVNATWDWGFGDWETPLGAASHTGQRGIAEYLLANGARIDIFAAAMMGFTEVVKSFVVAQPGIERTLGPHGITLLAHAKAGGERATETVVYLESLGSADAGLQVESMPEADRQKYLGQFTSADFDLKLACRLNRTGLLVIDVQTGNSQSNNRLIRYLGNHEFFPSGVPSVRIQFGFEQEQVSSVTIRGSVPEVTLLL